MHDATRWFWPLAGRRGRVQVGRSHRRRRRRGRTRPQRKAALPRHPGTAVPVACVHGRPRARPACATYLFAIDRLVRAALARGTASQITAHTATAHCSNVRTYVEYVLARASDLWPAVSAGRTRIGSDGSWMDGQ